MYGTLFDYNGFGLSAIKNEQPNTCVPSYLLQLYNKRDEPNPRKRLAKLNMNKLLKELEITNIDDGCSISQIVKFCTNHQITYYILDFKYKLFETNNHLNYI